MTDVTIIIQISNAITPKLKAEFPMKMKNHLFFMSLLKTFSEVTINDSLSFVNNGEVPKCMNNNMELIF